MCLVALLKKVALCGALGLAVVTALALFLWGKLATKDLGQSFSKKVSRSSVDEQVRSKKAAVENTIARHKDELAGKALT